jgi:ketosteroid isomerase-like protein
MSQENVEIVRRAYTAATRRPKPDFATVNALYHPDHEFVSLTSQVEGRSFVGVRGFRDVLNSLGDTWESWEITAQQIRSIDAERVLVIVVFTARGRRGGVSVERHFAHMETFRDGKVVRTEAYNSPEEALEAAGLRE